MELSEQLKQRLDFVLDAQGSEFTRAQHILRIIDEVPKGERAIILQYCLERFHLTGTSLSDTLMCDKTVPAEFEDQLVQGGMNSLSKMGETIRLMRNDADSIDVATEALRTLEGEQSSLARESLFAAFLCMELIPYLPSPSDDEAMSEVECRKMSSKLRREYTEINAIFRRNSEFPGTFTDHARKVLRILESRDDQNERVALLGYTIQRAMWLIVRVLLSNLDDCDGNDRAKRLLASTMQQLFRKYYHLEK